MSFLLAFIRVPLNKVEKSNELRPDSKQNIFLDTYETLNYTSPEVIKQPTLESCVLCTVK